MQSPNPDTLGFPQWGGVVNWGGNGQYILCFNLPQGTQWGGWALTDITDGIPFGDQVIPAQQYLANIPSSQTPAGDIFWNTLPSNFMQEALTFASNAGQVVTRGVQAVGGIATITADQIAQIFKALAAGVTPALSSLIVPVAIVAGVLFFTMYGRKN
jgi:hypothetical protein